MFTFTLIKSTGQRFNILPIVNNIEWESNLTLLTSLSFESAYSDAKYPIPQHVIDVGDHVILSFEGKEVFRGVIVDEERDGRGPRQYSAYDYTWYLAQSKTVYQFNNIPASQVMTRVLTDFGIPIGHIPTMPTLVDKIYIEETPAKILNETIALVESAEGYSLQGEMREGKIYLEKRKDLLITGRFRISTRMNYIDTLHSISEPKQTRTIADMRNRIRLIIEDEETAYIETAFVEDKALISQYGLLEETIKMDIEDSAKARQAAKIILERLGKVHETNSLTLLGDVRFKGGRLFDVKEPVTGMDGRFMIASAKHKIENMLHTMELELVLPSEVA